MSRGPVSAGHKLGQMVGEFFQEFFGDTLRAFAHNRKLYCDQKGPRPAVRGNKLKVTWIDSDGNAHDLDYVLEVGGSETKRGSPIAFIELAWRRYTKHSRNKTGEIEGALLHLRSTYSDTCRFLGTVLAGEFSGGGLQQLRSHGITILHIPFEKIAAAFQTREIDLDYPEDASDSVKWERIARWNSLSAADLKHIKRVLHKLIKSDMQEFISVLDSALSREVDSIRILSLFGEEMQCNSVEEGIDLLNRYKLSSGEMLEHYRFEIYIRFKNGDKIEGSFNTKEKALEFLSFYA